MMIAYCAGYASTNTIYFLPPPSYFLLVQLTRPSVSCTIRIDPEKRVVIEGKRGRNSMAEKPLNTTEHAPMAMLLSILGGAMDGYSYSVRGGVFATGQTGNLIIFSYSLVHGQQERAIRAFFPILGFWVGIFAAQWILNRLSARWQVRNWKRVVLLAEAAVLFCVGWIPDSVTDMIPNSIIALLAAMQFSSFKKIGDRYAYASVFCTGNMRSCAELYYQGLIEKNREALGRALQYTGILLSFLAGAIVSMKCGEWLGEKSIWLGSAMALLCSVFIQP